MPLPHDFRSTKAKASTESNSSARSGRLRLSASGVTSPSARVTSNDRFPNPERPFVVAVVGHAPKETLPSRSGKASRNGVGLNSRPKEWSRPPEPHPPDAGCWCSRNKRRPVCELDLLQHAMRSWKRAEPTAATEKCDACDQPTPKSSRSHGRRHAVFLFMRNDLRGLQRSRHRNPQSPTIEAHLFLPASSAQSKRQCLAALDRTSPKQ